MHVGILPELRSCGHALDADPSCLGRLREASAVLADDDDLRRRMRDDGYLRVRGLLDRDTVLNPRRAILTKLIDKDIVDSRHPLMDGIAHPDYHGNEQHLLSARVPELQDLLYTGPIMQLVTRLIGMPAAHYDYTWMRVIAPGQCTFPHCDVVYMGRGEQEQLYTAWTPLGDVDFDLGGLTLLEGSHRHQPLRENYCTTDVDRYCENLPRGERVKQMNGENGVLTRNPRRLRDGMGGRWLVSDFRAGDVLLFNIFTVHCGLENHTNRIRLSTDSRYQPQGRPLDERWNGPNPLRHGAEAKQGMIC